MTTATTATTATGDASRIASVDRLLAVIAIVLGALAAAVAASRPRGVAGLLASAGFAALVWWTSNTVAHIHLHRPLFAERRAVNRAFSLYLSLLLGVPQTIWRRRHLWHHADEPALWRPPSRAADAVVEAALIAALWLTLSLLDGRAFVSVYLPGYLLGLLLCQAQGHFEHAGVGSTGISHYGAIYNRLWLNDGYHVEHHQHPGEHWTRLPSRRDASSPPPSRWPPVLRWATGVGHLINRAQARLLEGCERWALASPRLQRFMIATHERAFREILERVGSAGFDCVCVVGGGLFPRSAIVLARLLPASHIVLVDESVEHLDRARGYLVAHGHALDRFELITGRYDAGATGVTATADLLVVPLAFVGDRDAIYRAAIDRPPAAMPRATVVHDWAWRRRGRHSVVISWWLCKRLNLA